MSSQVSNFPTSIMKTNDIPDVKRSLAIFHPNIWKEHFLSFTFDDALKVDEGMKERTEKLKEEIRMMMIAYVENQLVKLNLVDSIQRLGVSYHFEDEIDEFLKHIYVSYNNSLLLSNKDIEGEDLHITALLFRLLRQQGYRISCDIFLKFMDDNGKFKESLVEDERGILSLYEASHMMVHGEALLEEALEFTTTHLQTYVHRYSNINPSFASEVSNALKLPIRKGVPRMKAREYLEIYQQHPSHNETLLTFSKLDFNALQKLHQKELAEICRWWKDLNVSTNFPFARDQIVECYFWILSIYFEPRFKFGRKILTKVIAMTSIMDDIYDAYGTFEELQVFTLAIKRWDMSMINLLPKYMKVYYTTLLDLFEEIDKEIVNDETSYRFHFAKEAMKRQAESYFKEAEWLNKNYKPKYEEYMEVALASSGYELLSTISFVCMGDIATKEIFDWLFDCPKILKASTTISRLMDDVVSYKFEKEREHVVSAVECYMNNYGCSEEETCADLLKQVEDAWKTINKCCLHPMTVPIPFLICVLNLTRVMALLYSGEDGYTNSKGRTKLLIQSLLIDPLYM
ncbi:(+)-gamma-cadinene synthase-like [Cucumis melo]|uniref:(+)-gamma-cadinene synthase-like n=1 Tax=Cucumis melo TaxID=3656 RepID=A0A0B4VEV4_CUCME|nr:(+)-gamma-cadinene synthase-like [Cucumis melo]AJD19682.1 sesquiterpene synthase Tps1 [Cucumis melo]